MNEVLLNIFTYLVVLHVMSYILQTVLGSLLNMVTYYTFLVTSNSNDLLYLLLDGKSN